MALVALDFDGTLSESDMTVLLSEEHDVGSEVGGLAEQGRRGDLDAAESLRERVALLEGLQREGVEDAYERISLREGVADLLGALRASGVHVAVVSEGFERGVRTALDRADAGADTIVANRLPVENGALTGAVEGPLVDERSDAALERIVATEAVGLDETFAVGDGPTDLPMLQVAGTAIGFDPAPEVERYADEVVHSVRELRQYFEQHGVIDA